MLSLPQLCATTGLPFLAWLSLLPLFLSLNTGVHGATLREPRLWVNEPNAFRPASQAPPPPSAAMLQALQYIQSLSKRTLHDPIANINNPDAPEDDPEDLEHVRAMLQLATPARTSSGMRDSRGEEEERDGEQENEDDKAQQWIQAVLSTLQQTEDQMSPQKTPHREPTHSLTPTRPLFVLTPAVQVKQHDERTGAEDYGRSSLDNQGVRRHHRKFPLMFEDKDGQDQPLKRTNENAEEQYTPQKLATLQSVFEELSRMPKPELKANSNQQNTEDSEEGEENEGYRQKKMVFDDLLGDMEEALMPLEERTEQVEEETHRHEYNGGFGQGRDEQKKEDNDDKGQDKRSNRLDLLETTKDENPDDLSKLVDYYLMKVLEKTEQEEQKRDQGRDKEEKDSEENEEEDGEDEDEGDRDEDRREDEEEESEERDKRMASLPQYKVDPQSLYQLIQISKKLQIPPEDILDLLESEGNRKLGKSWQRKPTQSQIPSLRYPSLYSTRKSPATAPLYQRPLLQTSETSSVTQDILRILGLANAAKPIDKSLLRLNQYKSAPLALNYYMSERELPDYENSRDQREADYDDTLGEDELANLLAAEMLAQRPRRASLGPYDYFDQAVQSIPENRQPEQEETRETENSDEETLLKILNYLNPESEDTDEMDINGKMAGM